MSLLEDHPVVATACPHCGNDINTAPMVARAQEELEKAKAYGFETFWADYPKRLYNDTFRKVGRKPALDKWKRFDTNTKRLIYRAMKHYAQERDPKYIVDASRFLSSDYWRDWLEPAERTAPSTPQRPPWAPPNAVYDPRQGQWVA